MRGENAIRQEFAELTLWPAVDDEIRHEVQVGAGVEVVSDAGGDDGEDRCGALTAFIEPGEEPIFSTQDQPSKLALAPIVAELEVAVFEEQRQALPLPVQVAQSLTERRLGWDQLALIVDPEAELRVARVQPSRALREEVQVEGGSGG